MDVIELLRYALDGKVIGNLDLDTSILFFLHKILIEYNSSNNQYQSNIGRNHNRFLQDHRNEEQRKERREVTKLVDQCRIGSDTHGDTETDERDGHFETTDIHACQQPVKVGNADAEYR